MDKVQKSSNSKHHVTVLYFPQNMILVTFVNFSKQSDGQIKGTDLIFNSDVEIFLYITICLINSSGASDPLFHGYQQLSLSGQQCLLEQYANCKIKVKLFCA
jgi:hypothetical protein